ncbi:hypothetical protein [Aquimarina aggregata]|uniref:hypothetical protein n=1 Tax=Aquimarina aggregata TaxID=1642818 RepID=UPI002491FE46|nr:hypothetical protein [Aquimarina aggregata]
MGKPKMCVFLIILLFSVKSISQEKQVLKKKLDSINKSIAINFENNIISLDSLLGRNYVFKSEDNISIKVFLKNNTQYNSLGEINFFCDQIIHTFHELNRKTIPTKYKKVLNSTAEEIEFLLYTGTYIDSLKNKRQIRKRILLSIKYNTRLESLIFDKKYKIEKSIYHDLQGNKVYKKKFGLKFLVPSNDKFFKSIINKSKRPPLFYSSYYGIPIGRYSFRLAPNSLLNERATIRSIGDKKEYVEKFFNNELYKFFHLNFIQYKDKINVLRTTKEVFLSGVNGLISKDNGVWENIQLIYDVWIEDFSDRTMKINLLFILDGRYIKKRPGKDPSKEYMITKGIDFENSIYERQFRAFGYNLYNKFENYIKNERK